MAGWIVHALRLAGALLSVGGLVWSTVAWIWGGGLATVFSLLGPPEYAALAVIFFWRVRLLRMAFLSTIPSFAAPGSDV